ncbi:MAG: twin-arginine translocase TatA/TatE family subunit [Opitutaceae bacterium]|nr:twin-arginine translocase TatA/TatE family subunit [Opitutaceae bacterium]
MQVSLLLAALPSLALFNVGGTEMIVILLIVLLLFGGDKMPDLARGIGKAMRDFKKAAAGVEEELKKAMDDPPARKTPRPSGETSTGDDGRRFDLPQPLTTRKAEGTVPQDPQDAPTQPPPASTPEPYPGAAAALPKPPPPPAAPESRPPAPRN